MFHCVTNTSGKRADDGDEEEDADPKRSMMVLASPPPYQTYRAHRQQTITHFYITKIITDPEHYTEMVHTLRSAQPQDIIYMHMNFAGGRLDTGVQIINAMKDSEARIVAVLDSKAYSLGTLLFLAADEFIIHDNCMFMIHNYSGGIGGKGNEQASELTATLAWFKKLAKKYYIPFLSQTELDAVLEGRDMWMESDEIKKRLKNMVRLQNEAAIPRTTRKRGVEDGVLPEAPLVTEEAAATKTPRRTRESKAAMVSTTIRK